MQQLVLSRLSSAVATQLASTVGCLQDSYVGTLQRCLESLEKHCMDTEEGSIRATDALRQVWAQIKKAKDLFFNGGFLIRVSVLLIRWKYLPAQAPLLTPCLSGSER